MFSHVMVGSDDIARSRRSSAMPLRVVERHGQQTECAGCQGPADLYAHNGGVFLVSPPIDGKPATHANGGAIGFTMANSEQAAAWHKAGVANGGTAIEDPPGVRQGGSAMYLALLRDPDGNKLCALHRMPAA